VLPEAFAADDERLRRFQREAKVLASLNHPGIAAIYGLEQSGETHYLVLELVPGETLAERIARSPIPIDDAIEIADAGGGTPTELLTASHEGEILGSPQLLAGGRTVLFTVRDSDQRDQAALASLETGEWQPLLDAHGSRFVPATGHLVFKRNEALWAIAFDPVGLRSRTPDTHATDVRGRQHRSRLVS
jgi:hypothetical protein